jgi:hypothetical protein
MSEAIDAITYRIGDATAPEGDGPKIIAHVCNDVGAWGAGFVMALSRRWDEPEARYHHWHDGHPGNPAFRLSEVQFVDVGDGIEIANMLAQRGFPTREKRCALDYYALKNCLRAIAVRALTTGATIHMPRIGSGIAGGDWALIEQIILDDVIAAGVPVTVYDLPPVIA